MPKLNKELFNSNPQYMEALKAVDEVAALDRLREALQDVRLKEIPGKELMLTQVQARSNELVFQIAAAVNPQLVIQDA